MSQPRTPLPSRFDPRVRKVSEEEERDEVADATSGREGRPPSGRRGRGRPPRIPRRSDARVAELARLAIDWPRVSLEVVSEGSGLSVASLTAYRGEVRRLTPRAARGIVRWLRAHAEEGLRIADELDRLTREDRP